MTPLCHLLSTFAKDIKQIIIYASLHGAAKRYAERLAEITGIEAKAIKETYGQAIDFVNFDTLTPLVEKCTIGA